MRHSHHLLLPLVLLLLLVTTACQQQDVVEHDEDDHEAHPISVSNWTAHTEVFLEFPPLVSGETSRFALHVTLLDSFKPMAKGTARVRLLSQSGAALEFLSDAPSRPGIFGIDVKPETEGRFRLVIDIEAENLTDSHDLGAVSVATSKSEVPHEHEDEDPNAVSFLKEQQWTLDFATSVVESRPLRRSLRVPAEVLPRSGGEAEVSVPFDGRLVLDGRPTIGTRVTKGQVLASLLPPTSAPSDLSTLELAREEAELALDLARKDRQRAQRLVESGAAPAKRLDEAQTLEATQAARLKAARDRLAQYDRSSVAEGGPSEARLFSLRAPISGILTMVDAAPNANVKAGDTLFRIVDADTVYVSAIVPESELPLVRELSGAQLEVPGGTFKPLTRLIAVGRVVDPQSRTFPVIYQIDNRDRSIAINQTLHIHLLTRLEEPTPVVPESSLVDDAGRPVVFVQTAGETFVRRPVRLGIRQGDAVQLLEGASAGDRVVTRGAHLIRLATLATQVPAEGHVH